MKCKDCPKRPWCTIAPWYCVKDDTWGDYSPKKDPSKNN